MKRSLYGLTVPLYLLDQLTKWAVLFIVPEGQEIPVIPGFFNIVRVYNTGAAFGMFQRASAFFAILSAVAFFILVWLMRKGAFQDKLSCAGAALLLAGIAGNLTDRLWHGHVVDFLDFILPFYGHWPAFNVADSCICVAAALFFIAAFRSGKPVRRA